MRGLALALCLLAAGCTTAEPVEVHNVYLYPDSATEEAQDASQEAPGEEAAITPEPAPEASPGTDSAPEPAPEAGLDAMPDGPSLDSALDAQQEADATPEAAPACTGPGLGDGCEEATPDNAQCCPGLICSALRCVDPDAGVDGAIACPCNSCGCVSEGEMQIIVGVSSGTEDAVAWCPPLWVSYGPWGGCNTVWIPDFDGNQAGGHCVGKTVVHIQCAPCYEWKAC